MSKGKGRGPSPNDQRSNAMNPNNAAHQASANNTTNQGNPNNPAFASSRGKTTTATTTATEGTSEGSKQ